jgi:hypothetical protein
MATKPDYHPANPPLPNGHPLQYHFDPFLQNADQYTDKGNGRGKTGKHLKPFTNFNGPSEGAYTRQENQESPPYSPVSYEPSSYTSSVHEEEIDLSDIPQPAPKKKRKKSRPKPTTVHHYEGPTTNYVPSHEVEYGSPQKPNYESSFEHDEGHSEHEYTPPVPPRGSRSRKRPNPSSHLFHEGESGEKGHRAQHQQAQHQQAQHQQPQRKPAPIYSNSAYVLMFPNMVPERAMLPPKPLINGKEIPVISASSEVVESLRGSIMSPGFHAAKVHPREQMVRPQGQTTNKN